jgi:uncharacterized protein (DUF1778 family)
MLYVAACNDSAMFKSAIMDIQAVYLRLPADLKAAVDRAAAEEGVSVNEFAAAALSDAVADKMEPEAGIFDRDATIRCLIAAAVRPDLITYGGLAESHGFKREDWARVRHHLYAHLYDVGRECARRGWPMLTALVVNAQTRRPSRGLQNLAEQLGVPVADFETFARDQQQLAYDWASQRFASNSTTDADWDSVRGSWKGPPADDLLDWTRGPPDETDRFGS